MTDTKALNEKLIKWLYPKARVRHGDFYSEFIPSGKPWRTHMIDAQEVPNFTTSLDACFKWLIPKLTRRCIDPEIIYDHDMDYWQITLKNWTSNCSLDSPTTECKEADEIPLNLCRAIETLIDLGAMR
jgi:hypothetical protein